MTVEIQAPVPVEYAGDLMGDLKSRRGRIGGMETNGATQFLQGADSHERDASTTRAISTHDAGQASFHMEFGHYDYVPQLQADKIIAASKAARGRRSRRLQRPLLKAAASPESSRRRLDSAPWHPAPSTTIQRNRR